VAGISSRQKLNDIISLSLILLAVSCGKSTSLIPCHPPLQWGNSTAVVFFNHFNYNTHFLKRLTFFDHAFSQSLKVKKKLKMKSTIGRGKSWSSQRILSLKREMKITSREFFF
jgi:hypothetical protein